MIKSSSIKPFDSIMTYETHSCTDIGSVRKLNEDSLLAMPESGLWVVADGMGGHSSGDFASRTIVEELSSIGRPTGSLDLKARFKARLENANVLIRTRANNLGGRTIGSTVVALLIQQNHFTCIWSGDSRMYRIRETQLERLSRDHTEVQQLLDSGSISIAEAETWPRKNVITRAIGVSEKPELDIVEGMIEDADIFLLCSDGLTEYFQDDELEHIFKTWLGEPSNRLCTYLIETALKRGGKDNITVIVIRCHRTGLPELAIEGHYPEVRELS